MGFASVGFAPGERVGGGFFPEGITEMGQGRVAAVFGHGRDGKIRIGQQLFRLMDAGFLEFFQHGVPRRLTETNLRTSS